MSLLNPVTIDNVTLYLDQIVKVLDRQGKTEILFADNTTLTFDSSITASFLSNLPDTFLWYEMEGVWINDLHIKYSVQVWNARRRQYHILTYLTIGTVTHYSDTGLNIKMQADKIQSTDSLAATPDEVAMANGLLIPDMGIYYNSTLNA